MNKMLLILLLLLQVGTANAVIEIIGADAIWDNTIVGGPNPAVSDRITVYDANVLSRFDVVAVPSDLGSKVNNVGDRIIIYDANVVYKSNLISFTDPPVASITVTTPNGGENWISSNTYTIGWTSSGSTGENVKIELLKNGIFSSVINISTPNDGSYSWTILSGQMVGNDYKIRITSVSDYTDTSDNNFIISSTTAPVIFSIGRYRMAVGDTMVIPLKVNTTVPIGAIDISLLYNPSVTMVNSVIAGDASTGQPLTSNIDNVAGRVNIGMISSAGLTTNGSLANIEFGTTATSSVFTDIAILVNDLQTPNNVHILSQTINGSIEIYTGMVGDVDRNGYITASDALLYLRYAVGQDISPYHIDTNDDVTCDDIITAADALKVLRKAVGQDVNLEC